MKIIMQKVQKVQTNSIIAGKVWLSIPAFSVPATQPEFIKLENTIRSTPSSSQNILSKKAETTTKVTLWGAISIYAA